jgi:serine/threonine-protein kinase
LAGISGRWCARWAPAKAWDAPHAATHRNGDRVAIKMLHGWLSAEDSLRDRFLREGYVANAVGHRGAVRVHDDDAGEDGSVFLVMELLDGSTLDAVWEKHGRKLPHNAVVSLAIEVLDVLAAAHAKGIIHRDIKPENLFITREARVKVLDFGIARMREITSVSNVTRTGSTLGTPAFMSPEQALGKTKDVDASSDLFAVGAVMFTMITGRYVHDGETANEVMVRAATQPAPRHMVALLRMLRLLRSFRLVLRSCQG